MQLELVIYESLKEVVVEEMSEELQGLLNKYEGIFLEPKGLPPTRLQDHRIPLLPGSVPPNIRPYRYPYVQKGKTEKVVNELLIVGSIQKSASSFSSLVLLVRKKDMSWRMCVDHRALNNITIKDKFPTPVID